MAKSVYKRGGGINTNFSYVEDIDYEKAEGLISRIKNIHEIPVVKNGEFIGVIANGEHKSKTEWNSIRKRNKDIKYRVVEWEEEQLKKFLTYVHPKIYIYFGFDMGKLEWKKEDYEVLNHKLKYENGLDGLVKMSNSEKRDFFGTFYDKKYIQTFIDDYKKLKYEYINGIPKIGNIHSDNFNVINGCRQVRGYKKNANKKIIFLGPCLFFGAYTSDNQTVEYYLCELMKKNGLDDYEILNMATMNADITLSGKLLTEAISNDDIIVSYVITDRVIKALQDIKDKYPNIIMGSDLTQVYNGLENPAVNIVDGSLNHCNYKINRRIADIIFHDIKTELKQNNAKWVERKKPLQDYYISWDIVQYYKEFKDRYIPEERKQIGSVGSVVMNCNPFTKGHRYLIERASAQVELLYVFVVEEDASQFQFKDRMNMVMHGVEDLDNVCVLPSGKYIISKETFAQYFYKESVSDICDMSYDLHIFAEVIAKEFNIGVRFVGEEPFDMVTNKYNETMKKILSQRKINVVEIPRIKNDKQEIISASLARKCINEKNFNLLERYLPDSTIKYLKSKGVI